METHAPLKADVRSMSTKCSVCGASEEAAPLVAGPRDHLCANCIRSSVDLFLSGKLDVAERMEVPESLLPAHCSFCGRLREECVAMVGYGQLTCCAECLGKCVELVITHRSKGRGNAEVFAIPPHLS